MNRPQKVRPGNLIFGGHIRIEGYLLFSFVEIYDKIYNK